jgi:hypothetical protein
MQQPAVELVQELAARSPRLFAMVNAHMDDNGELLPTLILADAATWFVRSVENRALDSDQYKEAKHVVAELGAAFATATGELENTIAVGFVETILPPATEPLPQYVAELPEPLQTELFRMLSWRPAR